MTYLSTATKRIQSLRLPVSCRKGRMLDPHERLAVQLSKNHLKPDHLKPVQHSGYHTCALWLAAIDNSTCSPWGTTPCRNTVYQNSKVHGVHGMDHWHITASRRLRVYNTVLTVTTAWILHDCDHAQQCVRTHNNSLQERSTHAGNNQGITCTTRQ